MLLRARESRQTGVRNVSGSCLRSLGHLYKCGRLKDNAREFSCGFRRDSASAVHIAHEPNRNSSPAMDQAKPRRDFPHDK